MDSSERLFVRGAILALAVKIFRRECICKECFHAASTSLKSCAWRAGELDPWLKGSIVGVIDFPDDERKVELGVIPLISGELEKLLRRPSGESTKCDKIGARGVEGGRIDRLWRLPGIITPELFNEAAVLFA